MTSKRKKRRWYPKATCVSCRMRVRATVLEAHWKKQCASEQERTRMEARGMKQIQSGTPWYRKTLGVEPEVVLTGYQFGWDERRGNHDQVGGMGEKRTRQRWVPAWAHCLWCLRHDVDHDVLKKIARLPAERRDAAIAVLES